MISQLPMIADLRRDNWAKLSPMQRLGALQKMEDQLAVMENRDRCTLSFFSEDTLSQENNRTNLMGQYEAAHIQNGMSVPETIQLNPGLLQDGQPPYAGLETYFHEARHAYQSNVANHPDQFENSLENNDFHNAFKGGYLNPPAKGSPDAINKFIYYRCQPTEVDANNVGQSRTAQVSEQFGDLQGYLDYQNSPAYAQQRDEFAIARLPGYQEDARNEVNRKYNLEQAKSADQSKIIQEGSEYPQTPAKDRDVAETTGQLAAGAAAPEETQALVDESQSHSAEALGQEAASNASKGNEDLAQTTGELAGEAAGVPGGAEAGKAAGDAAKEAQGQIVESQSHSAEALGQEAASNASKGNEDIAQTTGELAGEAAGVSGGAEAGKVTGEAAKETQGQIDESIGQSTEARGSEITSDASKSGEQTVQSAGEVAGEASGVPGGAAAGKFAGDAADKTQDAVEEQAGQSSDAPAKAIENAAENAPSKTSEPDEEQYYGYGL